MNTDPGARLAGPASLLLPVTSCAAWGKFFISLDLSVLNYEVDMKQDLPHQVMLRMKRADACTAPVTAPGSKEVQILLLLSFFVSVFTGPFSVKYSTKHILGFIPFAPHKSTTKPVRCCP